MPMSCHYPCVDIEARFPFIILKKENICQGIFSDEGTFIDIKDRHPHDTTVLKSFDLYAIWIHMQSS
jgi:hypothetical protein